MSLDWPRFSSPLREPVDEDRAQRIAEEKADHDYNIMKNDEKKSPLPPVTDIPEENEFYDRIDPIPNAPLPNGGTITDCVSNNPIPGAATPTEWVQKFHPPGQTRDCIHFRLARSCEICGLEKELFYSRRENAELCAFINREMKMTGNDPRIAELVKRAGGKTDPPSEAFRPTRGYEQVVSLEDYQKLQRELADANKEAAWLVPARNSVVEACVILPNVAEYIFQLEKERDEWRKCTEKLVEFSNPRVSHVIEYWEILNKFNKLKGKQ